MKNLKWHFPSSGGGEEDGVNDSGLEMFEGDHAYFLAREVIQNSIDARRADCKHVEVHFRLTHMSMAEFPGWPEFRSVLKACLAEVKEEAGDGKGGGQSKGEVLYNEALAMPARIPVLVAEDFNTSGLCGKEDEKGGQWYKCIRKKGANRPTGDGGGTFGIGKHAPFPASKLRSVFYSTINDRKEPAFTGKAILSSFELGDDVKRGTGFFGAFDGKRAAGIREISAIPPFFRRKEQGLSLFIMGFREEGDWKVSLMKAVLENFFAAIDRKLLKIVFDNHGEREVVDDKTLAALIRKYTPETEQYLEAIRHPLGGKPIEGNVPLIGHVQLYLAHGKEYARKVAFMRRPLIVVQKKTRKLVHEAFAGVFVCDDRVGNGVLGRLEPPTHDKWDAKRDPLNGQKVMAQLNEWVNQELRALNRDTGNEREDVADLADYLAEDQDLPGEQGDAAGKEQPSSESGYEAGKEKERDTLIAISTRRQTPRFAKAGGGGKLKRTRRGDGKMRNRRGGGPGDGGPKRVDINVGVRWIPESATSNRAVLILRPIDAFSGQLRLVGVGEDGTVDMHIKSASIEGGERLDVRNGAILGASLEAGKTLRVKVELDARAWEAVSLEAYER